MTAVEWVREDDWSKVAVGDRVRIERANGDCAEFSVRRVDTTRGSSLRLESQADTARKVLERVTEVLRAGGITTFPNEYSNLAAEFGVTL